MMRLSEVREVTVVQLLLLIMPVLSRVGAFRDGVGVMVVVEMWRVVWFVREGAA